MAGSRVTLASVIACWKDGLSPESIAEEFTTLSLEQVYGAIAYYLHNQPNIESHLKLSFEDFQRRSEEHSVLHPQLRAKILSGMHGR